MIYIAYHKRKFYRTKAWEKLRKYIVVKYHGLCQNPGCHNAGYIVHHIIHVTDENENDPEITLNEDNLTLLCQDCHNMIHHGSKYTRKGMMFDSEGNPIGTVIVDTDT